MYKELFKNITFIFLVGRTQIGKDTYARKIKQKFKKKGKNVQIISIAEYLHEFFERKNIDYRENREEVYRIANLIKKKEGENFFCLRLFTNIDEKNTDIVIVPDLRFKHEEEFFKRNLENIKIIKLIRKDQIEPEVKNFFDYYEIEEIKEDEIIYI